MLMMSIIVQNYVRSDTLIQLFRAGFRSDLLVLLSLDVRTVVTCSTVRVINNKLC